MMWCAFALLEKQTIITFTLEISKNTSSTLPEKMQEQPNINLITLVILAHLHPTKAEKKLFLPLFLW